MKLLRIEEAASMLGFSTQYVYQLVKDGMIPTLKIGVRSLRIREDDLIKWAKAKDKEIRKAK